MSVESDIETALALVRAEATVALNDAAILAATVADGIDKPLKELKAKFHSDFNAPELPTPTAVTAPPVPRQTTAQLPDRPTADLRFLAQKIPTLDADLPTLNLPTFTHTLAPVPDLPTVTPPTLGERPDLPTVPTDRLGESPVSTPPRWVTLTPVQADAPPLTPPDALTLPALRFTEEFDRGLAWAQRFIPPDWGGMAALAGLDPVLFQGLEQRLRGELETAAFDEGYAQRRYGQQRAEVEDAREQARTALEQRTAAGGVAIPGMARWSGEWDVERNAAVRHTATAAAVRNQIADAEQAHAQQALTLMETLLRSSLTLRYRSAELSMQGVETALQCGETALELALETLELKKKEFALLEMYYGLAQERVNLLVKAAQNQGEVAQENAQQSILQVSYNAALLKQYRIQWSDIQRLIRLQSEQQAAIQADLEMQAQPLRLFETQVRLFEGQVQQQRWEWEALNAQLQGDVERANGSLAKIKRYRAQQAAQAAALKADERRTLAQGERNTAVLTAMLAEIDALEEAFKLRVDAARLSSEAEKTHAQAENKLGEAQVAETRLELTRRVGDEQARLYRLRSDLAQRLKQQAIQLEQAKAKSAVRCGGARVYAGIANAMLSALNGIAIKSEEAYA